MMAKNQKPEEKPGKRQAGIIRAIQKMMATGEPEEKIIKTLVDMGVNREQAKRLVMVGQADTLTILQQDIGRIAQAQIENQLPELRKLLEPQLVSARGELKKILKDELDLDGTAFNHSDYPEADCVKCHFDVVEGDGAAISERCVTCHSEIERLARVNDIEFMHRTHVTDNKVECSGCHTPIKHEAKTRMPALEPACTVCHTAAHDAVHNMLLGKGGHDVKGEPAQMFLTRVSCVGCHVEPTAAGRDAHLSQEVTFRASGKGYADCHGEEFAELFEETKEYHSDMIASLDEEIASLEAALSDLPDGDLKNRCGELLGGAKHNRDFVVLGQAMHNTMYAGALLDKATEDIAQIKEMIASSSSEAEQDGG